MAITIAKIEHQTHISRILQGASIQSTSVIDLALAGREPPVIMFGPNVSSSAEGDTGLSIVCFSCALKTGRWHCMAEPDPEQPVNSVVGERMFGSSGNHRQIKASN
jgi:hypothetical protein